MVRPGANTFVPPATGSRDNGTARAGSVAGHRGGIASVGRSAALRHGRIEDLAIAVTRFGVAGVAGSSAMMSEGTHSAVDSDHGVLPLIVAVPIFGVGSGVSFYEGVLHWREPSPIEDPTWNCVVLGGAAAVFDGYQLRDRAAPDPS